MKPKLRSRPFFAFFEPEGKSLKRRILLSVLTFLMLLLASVSLGVMNLYFGTGKYKLELLAFYFETPEIIVLNVLPFVLLCIFLWMLTNRAWISFLITGVFTLIYSWAEYWKLMGRSDPIVAEDLTIIKEGMQMGTKYITITWQIALSVVLVLLGTLVFFFFFRGRLPKIWFRLILCAGLICGCVFLYKGTYQDKTLYNSFTCWKKLNRWADSNQFISRGCMYPFLYSIKSAGVTPPDGYTAEAAKQILEEYDTDDIPEDKKVNVIVVMYEAFADLTTITDRITEKDPYVSFHALQEESWSGRLVTNIFAAGTINSERCVVTGFSELTDFRRASWSYARYFSDQGYAVEGSHPSLEAFYNRRSVNQNLGFDNYYFKENHYGPLAPKTIAGDSILLPEIVNLCRKSLETSDYVFSFNVTYQNHGPYSDSEQKFTEPYMLQGDLQLGSYYIVNNYLAGAEDTGNQMMAMVDLVRDDEEPYVLIFFGDHKPWCGPYGAVYAEMGIEMNAESEESFYNYYNTEYLIWANDAAKQKLGCDFVGDGPDLSPCYLMNELFKLCGWEGPSFLKLSNEVRGIIPVLTSTGRLVENGKLISEKKLSEEGNAAREKLRYAQFYLMRDSGGVLPARNKQ